MDLFEKSYQELREAFVRARFAEDNIFGRPDIEEWLAGQRTASRPDYSTWIAFAKCPEWFNHFGLAGTPTYSVLVRALSCFPSVPINRINALYGHQMDECCYVGRIVKLVERCRPETISMAGNSVIMSCGGEILVISLPDHSAAQDDNNISLRISSDVTSAQVLRVFIDRWASQNDERAEYARHFLCNAFGMHIAQVRGSAGLAFDTAVAVSADGTKIVHADWGVVKTPSKQIIVFPASAFHAQKALRPDDSRFERMSTERLIDERGLGMWTTDEAIGKVAKLTWNRYPVGLPDQVTSAMLLDFQTTGWKPLKQRIYMTHASLCPSPLPEGGVEVAV